MKKIVKAFFCILTMGIIVTLTGCGSSKGVLDEANAESLGEITVVIGGKAANTGMPDYTSNILTDAVEKTTSTFGIATVIRIGGEPSKAFDEDFNISENAKRAPKTKLDSDARVRAEKFMEKLSDVSADTPEMDYLKALHLASRELSVHNEDVRKRIIVIGSGLNTTGTLDFRNNILMASAEEITNMLQERDAIPKLNGVTVIWQQIGDVAPPQEELTYQQRNRLIEIWESIVNAGGGEFVLSESIPLENEEAAFLPNVSTVELPAEPVVKVIREETQVESVIHIEEPTFFNIEFKPDLDEYIDSSSAARILSPVANYMNQETSFKLLIVGTTAGDEDSAYVRQLSLDRAEAVRNTLVEFGVDSSRIEVVGLGNHDPWHIYGVGVDGPLAEQNRKVVMLPLDSEDAKSILESLT